MKNIKKNKGLTLIEVILSIAILSIIVITILSIFTMSMVTIYRSRDKTEAINLTQQNLEENIAMEDSYDAENMSLTFGGLNVSVKGGMAKSEKSVKNGESSLESFLPNIPTIQINPISAVEGYLSPLSINIIGKNTSFNNTSIVEIWDKGFNNKYYTYDLIEDVDDETIGEVEVTNNLLNNIGEYIVRVVTTLPDSKTEVSRAKLTILQPNLVLVNNDTLFVSEDGENWIERSDLSLDSSFPSVSNLTSIKHGKNAFIVLGENGLVLYSYNYNNWIKNYSNPNYDFSDISFSGDKFYASTYNGYILTSNDGVNWTQRYYETDEESEEPVPNIFNGIHSSIDNIVIAVGNRIYKGDGTIYPSFPDTLENNLNSVTARSDYNEDTTTYDHIFITVGDSGTILKSTDEGSTWVSETDTDVVTYNLNSVIYRDEYFIAVGNNGTIIRSQNGSDWYLEYSSGSNLNDIAYKDGYFIAVGDNSTVLKSIDNGDSWYTISDAVISGNLKSISGK